jgi:hypothetical protein
MIEQDVVEVLLADAAVEALVGDRIFPVTVRYETQLPAVTYQRMSGERTYTMGGRGGWATVRIGMSAWARDYSAARSIADAVRVALDAYEGGGTNDIQIARVADTADAYEETLGCYLCSLDVEIQYQEV